MAKAEGSAQLQVIERLLREASANGTSDPYRGKRRWRRYRLGRPLEVTTDPTRPGNSFQVTTHNVSGGGLGFWSKVTFEPGEPIFVREWTSDGPTAWVEGNVGYSVLGIHGYLVGVSFAHCTEPDSDFDPSRYRASDPQGPLRRWRWGRISLSTFCVLCCAAAGGLNILMLIGLEHAAGRFELLSTPWALPVGRVAATALVLMVPWFLIRHESKVLNQIFQTLRQLSSGTPSESTTITPWTREANRLGQAALDLAFAWKQCLDSERLRREQAEGLNRLKTNVLSMVSHDLRTPLTSIQMYAHILTQECQELSGEDSRQFLQVICEECTQLSRLLEDVLQVQRLEEGSIHWTMESTDVGALIRSAERRFLPIANSRQLQLRVTCPDNLPAIVADGSRISQVINNLLSNALKFTSPEGIVYLKAEARSAEVLISVMDTGPGIPRHDWDRVFDRFAQLAPAVGLDNRGSGLGLYIVRQIVEAHAGRVWLDSQLGAGTTMTVALPVAGPQDSPRLRPVGAEGTPSVLVCDADPGLVAVLAQLLRGHGCQTITAHSAGRLLEQIRERQIDVVLTDLVLPDMPTLDLLARLQEIPPDIVVIAHSLDGDLHDLRQHGIDLLLRRPCSPEELLKVVDVAIHKKTAGGPVVAVVSGWELDHEELGRQLTAAGCLPLVVRDEKTLSSLLNSVLVEILLLKTGPVGDLARWQRELAEAVSPAVLVGILHQPETGRVHELEHCVPIVYRRGAEAAAVQALSNAYEEACQEVR